MGPWDAYDEEDEVIEAGPWSIFTKEEASRTNKRKTIYHNSRSTRLCGCYWYYIY